MAELAKYTAELLMTLEEETGQATGYKQSGAVRLAKTEERMEELRRGVSMARNFGLEMWDRPIDRPESATGFHFELYFRLLGKVEISHSSVQRAAQRCQAASKTLWSAATWKDHAMAEKTTRSTKVDNTIQAAAETSRQPGLRSFVLARWRGEVPLRAALWWDMLCVGTAINVVAALAGMLLLAADLPAVIAAIVFFSPFPYNVLLLLSVWRSAERADGPAAATAQLVAVIWIILATAV